jgi:DNA modification methylase
MKPYYQDDFVTLYHCDCRDILPTLGKFDLLLTDPPYGTEDLGGGYGRRQNHDPKGRNGRTIQGDKDLKVFQDFINLLPVCANIDAVLVSFCAARRMNEVDDICQNAKLKFVGELIWDKATPGLGYTIRYSHESALVYSQGTIKTPENALISLIRKPVSHIDNHLKHPHEKPIEFWTNAMQIMEGFILDPFAGSGTTGRAAKDLGRKCVMIEREEKYCEIAAKRMLQECFNF